MNRSLYPEGVEVHQRHLSNTESTKSSAIKQLADDAISLGVASGLAVTVNTPDTTRVAISSGYGYAPNGELVTLTASINNISLADYTLNTLNYVLLMYDETASNPEAHETNGTTQNTIATVSARVVVLTAAQYTALSATDPVLTNNARDRALILAIVTASGPSIPLTSASIQGPTTFPSVLKVTQPVNISGIAISIADPQTSAGTGTLTFIAASKTITWAAPGDTAGAAVTLTTTQAYNIVSHSGRYLTIDVQYPLLPVVDSTDSIGIVNLYTQTVPRLTNDDFFHRSMVGSGTPTLNNPHGLTILDLDPGALNTVAQHQEVMHANGIIPANASVLPLQTNIIVASVPHQISISPTFSAGDSVYINGSQVQSLTGSPSVTFADGSVNQSMYAILISQSGTLAKQLRATFPAPGTSLLAAKMFIINVSDNITNTTKNITWFHAGSGTISFDGGFAKAAPTTDQVIRLFSSDAVSWIDVYVKGGSTPGSDQTDAITFTALPNIVQNFLLSYVAWSGIGTGLLGAGFGSANSPNYFVDRRLVGTIAPSNLRNDFGFNDSTKLVREIIGDGLVLQQSRYETGSQSITSNFSITTAASLSTSLGGGVAVIGGKRFEVASKALTVTDNTINRIYLDNNGVPQIAASISWSQIQDSLHNQPFLQLWELTMASGTDTLHTDFRAWLDLQRNQPFGVLGLDSTSAAVITSNNPTAALSVTATGAGASAIVGTAAHTNGIGIQGFGKDGGAGLEGFGDTTGTSDGPGVKGIGGADTGPGVWGIGGGTTHIGVGIIGFGDSTTTYTTANGQGAGVVGAGASTGSPNGVYGEGTNGGAGVRGNGGGSGPGIVGFGGGATTYTPNGFVGGYFYGGANGGGGDGVQAYGNGSGRTGVWAQGGTGGQGMVSQGGSGARGITATGGAGGGGAYFQAGSGSAHGLEGHGTGSGFGVYGNGDVGVYGQGGTWAGYFNGAVGVNGNMSANSVTSNGNFNVTSGTHSISGTTTFHNNIIGHQITCNGAKSVFNWSPTYPSLNIGGEIAPPLGTANGDIWVESGHFFYSNGTTRYWMSGNSGSPFPSAA